jgi:transposase-like protein
MNGATHRIGPSIIQTQKDFASEKVCHEYLEHARWPEGVRCLQCGGNAISKFTVKGKTRVKLDKITGETVTKTGPDRYMYQCLEKTCKYQFATTAGTIFSDTKLPLRIWMQAVALLCTAKKGISAKQMERTMGISYKTAWYLNHRIREAMVENNGDLFGTGGTVVEMDETYVGGKYDERRKRARYDKAPVFGILERSENGKPSRVRAGHIPQANRYIVLPKIKEQVSPDAKLMTDESNIYSALHRTYDHQAVCHIDKQWVRSSINGSVHTQGIDGFWSLLKRGIIGSFHQVSVKHLDRYISEFQFRFNNRLEQEIFAMVVTGLVIKGALRYKALTASPVAPVEDDLTWGDDSF